MCLCLCVCVCVCACVCECVCVCVQVRARSECVLLIVAMPLVLVHKSNSNSQRSCLKHARTDRQTAQIQTFRVYYKCKVGARQPEAAVYKVGREWGRRGSNGKPLKRNLACNKRQSKLPNGAQGFVTARHFFLGVWWRGHAMLLCL